MTIKSNTKSAAVTGKCTTEKIKNINVDDFKSTDLSNTKGKLMDSPEIRAWMKRLAEHQDKN